MYLSNRYVDRWTVVDHAADRWHDAFKVYLEMQLTGSIRYVDRWTAVDHTLTDGMMLSK